MSGNGKLRRLLLKRDLRIAFDLIFDAHEENLPMSEIARQCRKLGVDVSDSTVSRTLDKMADQGLLVVDTTWHPWLYRRKGAKE